MKHQKGDVQSASHAKMLFTLFTVFLKIGAFTFGGGYAMIPLIQKELSEKRDWIKEKDFLDIVAISESSPGPIAVKSATFVGFRIHGLTGAIAATTGVVLPSFVIISLISVVLREFEQIKAVKYAFFGIRAGILALILKALHSMFRQCPKGILSYIIMCAVFLCAAVLGVNVLILVPLSALTGLIVSLATREEAKK